MLDLQILAQGQPVTLFDLPALLGRAGAARELGDTIEGLIAFMDNLEGDADLEDDDRAGELVTSRGVDYDPDENVSEPDGLPGDPQDAEDGHDQEADSSDFEPDDDAQGDISWSEWHTRGRHKLTSRGAEVPTHSRAGWQLSEDDEDDDADTGVEDHPLGFDPEEDMSAEDQGELDETEYDFRPIADPVAYREHRDRIRRYRCTKRVDRYGYAEYRLISPHSVGFGSAVDMID